MNAAVTFLNENPVVFLATVDPKGHPRVRPFQFMKEEGGRLWFCTSSQKPVYSELQNTPALELSATSPSFAWIRISGQAVFEDNRTVKEEILAANDLVRSIYQTPDNPVFVTFYLKDAQAVITDFSGNPPQSVTF